MKLEKVYEVRFLKYEYDKDWKHKTVISRNSESSEELEKLDVGSQPFLVRESQLSYFREFGEGIESIKFVGNTCSPFDIDLTE